MRPAKICSDSRATTSSSVSGILPVLSGTRQAASCCFSTPRSRRRAGLGESGIGLGQFGQRSVSLAQITSARPSISLPVLRSGLGDGFLGPLALRFVREDATPGRSTEMQFRLPGGTSINPLALWVLLPGGFPRRRSAHSHAMPPSSSIPDRYRVTHGLFPSTAHRR